MHIPELVYEKWTDVPGRTGTGLFSDTSMEFYFSFSGTVEGGFP